MAESWKKLKTSNVFFSFIDLTALVRELWSNNSLFVSQLDEDKSLALRYNLPPNSEILDNNSLQELIYILNIEMRHSNITAYDLSTFF